MALTAEQLADFQNDLGIGADEQVFTDAELERLYSRAGEVYETAVYYAWRQVLAQATKYIDYKVALTEEKRSQVRAHISDMVDHWKTASDAASGSQGALLLGLNVIPTRSKEEPYDGTNERRRRLARGLR